MICILSAMKNKDKAT